MAYWRLFYHFIWGTKHRAPLIMPEFEQDLYNVMVAKAKNLGALVYAIGGVADHVHLVASVPPSIALAQFVGQVKGNSSHFVNHNITSLTSPFNWQTEYGAVSFGGKQLDVVVKYVHNQAEHHQKGTVIQFLECVNVTPANE